MLQNGKGEAENLNNRVGKLQKIKLLTMKKARIALASICILAAAGGVLAAKARFTEGYIIKNNVTIPVTVDEDCTVLGTGCKYTSSDNSTFQLLKYTTSVPGGPLAYRSVKE